MATADGRTTGMQIGRRGRRRSTVIMADEALLMQTLFKEQEARQQHQHDVTHGTAATQIAARSQDSNSYASDSASGSDDASSYVNSSRTSGSLATSSACRSQVDPPAVSAEDTRHTSNSSARPAGNRPGSLDSPVQRGYVGEPSVATELTSDVGSSRTDDIGSGSVATGGAELRRASLQSRRGSVKGRQGRRGSVCSRRGSVSSLSSGVSASLNRAHRVQQKRVKRLTASLAKIRASWAHEAEMVFELIARPRVGVGPEELAQVLDACPPRVRRQLDQLITKWRHEVSIGTRAGNLDLKAFTRLIVTTFYEPVMARAVDRRLDLAAVRVPFSLAVMAMRRQFKLDRFYGMFTGQHKQPTVETVMRPGLNAFLKPSQSSHRMMPAARATPSPATSPSRRRAASPVARRRPRQGGALQQSPTAAARSPSPVRSAWGHAHSDRPDERAGNASPSHRSPPAGSPRRSPSPTRLVVSSTFCAVFAWSVNATTGQSSFQRAEEVAGVKHIHVGDTLAVLMTATGQTYTWDLHGTFQPEDSGGAARPGHSSPSNADDAPVDPIERARDAPQSVRIVHELGLVSDDTSAQPRRAVNARAARGAAQELRSIARRSGPASSRRPASPGPTPLSARSVRSASQAKAVHRLKHAYTSVVMTTMLAKQAQERRVPKLASILQPLRVSGFAMSTSHAVVLSFAPQPYVYTWGRVGGGRLGYSISNPTTSEDAAAGDEVANTDTTQWQWDESLSGGDYPDLEALHDSPLWVQRLRRDRDRVAARQSAQSRASASTRGQLATLARSRSARSVRSAATDGSATFTPRRGAVVLPPRSGALASLALSATMRTANSASRFGQLMSTAGGGRAAKLCEIPTVAELEAISAARFASPAAVFIAKAKLRHAETQLMVHTALDARNKAGLGYLQKHKQLRENLRFEQSVVMARAGPLRLDVPQWTGLSPLDVACGSDHTVVAMQDGSLYAWGLATRGRLGLKSFGYLDTAATDRPAPPDPGIVPPVTLGPAAQAGVAGGQEEGEDKQTDNVRDADGDGVARLRSTDVQEVPARVELPCITVLPRVHRRVTQVACGACHTAVVAHDRSCFTWGFNIYGQLGTGDCLDRYEPCRLQQVYGEDLESSSGVAARMVACGDSHTVVLDMRGKVWAVGANWRGQLGVGCAPVVVDAHGSTELGPTSAAAATSRFRRNLLRKRSLRNVQSASRLVGASSRRLLRARPRARSSSVAYATQCFGSRGGLGAQPAQPAVPGAKACIQTALPMLVASLTAATVTQVTCGRDTTAALTLKSRVYVWGKALVQNPYTMAEEPDPEAATRVIAAVIGDHDKPTELPVLLQALQVLAAHEPHEVKDRRGGRRSSPRRASGGVRASGDVSAAVVGVAQRQLSDYDAGIRFCPPQPRRLHLSRIAIGCGGATLLAGLSSCSKPRPQVKVFRRLNTLRAMSNWATGGVAGLLRGAKGEASAPSAVLRKVMSGTGDLRVAAVATEPPVSTQGGGFGFGTTTGASKVAGLSTARVIQGLGDTPERQRPVPRLPPGSFNVVRAVEMRPDDV